ncbi:MAG TPA: outer membrane beta-barrel protein, partial [Mucilaginibacter sp.]|nr:outer membrane beta-barrel protein [Mucilaginibacter sp.]
NNFGITEALSVSPFKWWSLNLQAVYNHKQLNGFNGNNYSSYIDQLNVSTTNQFTIAKYTAELSGFYTTHARNDIQEYLYPTGQLSVGVSKPILNKKATLKLTARDILYTNAMEGLTQFPNATEYFKLKRDSRVVTLSFTYRFGKAYKTGKRTEGSATDEADRVGNG